MPTRHRSAKPISPRARLACAMFGLHPQVVERILVQGCESAAAQLDRSLRPGRIALVTGPSGSGKSTILRRLSERLRTDGRRVIVPPGALRDAAVVDQFDLPLGAALRLLARAGLADATVFALRPAQLSDGQRWRLTLALAMADTQKADAESDASPADAPATLILDEFASTLDRLTARCIARALSRWVRTAGRVRIVCATAHDDLLEHLAPTLLVRQPLNAGAEFQHAPGTMP